MGRLTRMRRALVGVFAVLILLVASASSAGVIVYTDRPSWEAAVGGSFIEESFGDPLLNSGVTISSGWEDPAAGVSGGVLTDRVSENHDQPYTMWTFDDPVFAFGGDWDMSPNDPGTGITASIFGELWSAHISSAFVGGFFGFVSAEAFTQVQLSEGIECGCFETYTVDNVVYASSSEVPEPGTLVLLGAGLLGLAGVARRLR